MALIKCPECEKEISNKTTDCPSCGAPVKHIKAGVSWYGPLFKQLFYGTFIIFLFVVVLEKFVGGNGLLIILFAYFPVWYFRRIWSISDKILPVLFYIYIFTKDTSRSIEVLSNFFGI